MNKINTMNKVKSKRNDLIEAILSRDKKKLKVVLQEGKPEKWVTIELDHKAGTISMGKNIYTKTEIDEAFNEIEKDHCLKLVVFHLNKEEDGTREEFIQLMGRAEIDVIYQKVSPKGPI